MIAETAANAAENKELIVDHVKLIAAIMLSPCAVQNADMTARLPLTNVDKNPNAALKTERTPLQIAETTAVICAPCAPQNT